MPVHIIALLHSRIITRIARMRLESHADANQQIARMAEKDVIAKYSEAIWARTAASQIYPERS